MNQGFDPIEIATIRKQMEADGRNFVVTEGEPQAEDFANFLFIGQYEGKEVIYDGVMYTLSLLHNSKLYEMAEEKAREKYPDYQGWELQESADGQIAPMGEIDEEVEEFKASIVMELEEDESVKVQEVLELDSTFDFGIGLEVALNVEVIDEEVITRFIESFNNGTFKLDETLYSFQHDDEMEEGEDDEDEDERA
jgi:hypothetical protein